MTEPTRVPRQLGVGVVLLAVGGARHCAGTGSAWPQSVRVFVPRCSVCTELVQVPSRTSERASTGSGRSGGAKILPGGRGARHHGVAIRVAPARGEAVALVEPLPRQAVVCMPPGYAQLDGEVRCRLYRRRVVEAAYCEVGVLGVDVSKAGQWGQCHGLPSGVGAGRTYSMSHSLSALCTNPCRA